MRKLTEEQKAQLKIKRKEAYTEMKKKRDNDPRYIALKEAQKKRKREIYQEYKNRLKAEKEAKKAEDRQKRNEELLKKVRPLG